MLLITSINYHRFCDHRREQLNVIKMSKSFSSSTHTLLHFFSLLYLSTLVMLPWWCWQNRSIHAGNW